MSVSVSEDVRPTTPPPIKTFIWNIKVKMTKKWRKTSERIRCKKLKSGGDLPLKQNTNSHVDTIHHLSVKWSRHRIVDTMCVMRSDSHTKSLLQNFHPHYYVVTRSHYHHHHFVIIVVSSLSYHHHVIAIRWSPSGDHNHVITLISSPPCHRHQVITITSSPSSHHHHVIIIISSSSCHRHQTPIIWFK